MVPAISYPGSDHGYDPLDLLMNENDAKDILDALACFEDCHPEGTRQAVGFLDNSVSYGPVVPPAKLAANQPPQQQQEEYKRPCHPYFYYRDFSTLPDPDSAAPITSPGRIPNFPAKMYAILSRKDLADTITWLPHGRSWKVLKPREFEVKVIPTYFEHSKFSSFIRQANGWGFRRIISKGADRNSYYHELFLRGCPHLIKLMRRPPPSSKPLADAPTEPDFHAISKERPLPEIKEGDAATDAAVRGTFPRQAAYSFFPPPSYIPPYSSNASPVPAPGHLSPTSTDDSPPSANNDNHQQPVLVSPQPSQLSATHPGASVAKVYHGDSHSVPLYPSQHPMTHYHDHYQPLTSSVSTWKHPADVLSSGPCLEIEESADPLLDLLNKPLPPPETFGSHTFYPLLE